MEKKYYGFIIVDESVTDEYHLSGVFHDVSTKLYEDKEQCRDDADAEMKVCKEEMPTHQFSYIITCCPVVEARKQV